MKRIWAYFVLSSLVIIGCAPITSRVDSYRALPVDVKSFVKRSSYVRIMFVKNSILDYGERGTAWKIVVWNKKGKKSYFWATEFAVISKKGQKISIHDRKGRKLLLSIILKDISKFRGSKFALISHDATHYYQPSGKEIPAYRFNWKKHGTSFADSAVKVIRCGSKADQAIENAFIKVMITPMARKYGTSLSEAEFKHLARQDSKFRKFLRELLRLEVPIMFPFNAVAILANMGILKVVKLINVLGFRVNLNHPEYFSGRVTNRQRAKDRILIEVNRRRIQALENQVHKLQQKPTNLWLR